MANWPTRICPGLPDRHSEGSGPNSCAPLRWPGLKDIELVAVDFETCGRVTEVSVQIMGYLGVWQATVGCLYWLGGDFNVDREKLVEPQWIEQMHGSLRE